MSVPPFAQNSRDLGDFFRSDDLPPGRAVGPHVEVFSKCGVADLERSADGKDSEVRSRILGTAKKLRQLGGDKPLAVVPLGWEVFLDGLEESHPNFHSFIEVLRDQFALTAHFGDGRVSLPPVLLDGPPGIGKTDFALTLAAWLQAPLLCLDMASAQSGAALAGSDAFWSNSQPGRLFDALALGPVANPVVMLDELDKVATGGRYSPEAALYQLLEPKSAMQFRDLSVPQVPLDASHVVWIATTNTSDVLSAPIRSRFVELSIPAPTREQVLRIVHSIYAGLRERKAWGRAMHETLPGGVAEMLADCTPRAIRVHLERACGRAARQGRSELVRGDVEIEKKAAPRRGIGFTGDL